MLPEYIDKYCNYTREIKEQGLMCTKITYSSYGSKTEIVNEQFNLNISRQSIYLHEKELSPQYISLAFVTLQSYVFSCNVNCQVFFC